MAKIKKEVEARFSANDKVTKRFSVMERAAARFGRNTEKSFKRANRAAGRFQTNTKAIVAGLGISRGLGLISQGVGSVVRQFIDFDKAALGATVRFKDIGPKAANFNEKLKEIEKSARDAGATTEFTAAQSAAALDFLARAGFTSAEAMGALGSMINLATASGEEFEQVADKSSDLLGSFGLNAENTAQKIANLNRLNDVLVKSANSANVTIETMFETMKTAAPIGRKIGIELEEVAALTAVLGNAGIKGTEAGTSLKNMFLRLSAATPETTKMLRAVGVQIDDGSGNMRKFTDIMKDLSQATGEFGNLKVARVLDTLFGKRAIAGAANVGDAIKQLEDLEKTLKDAGGTSQLTADIMRTSIEAKLKTLGSAATEFGFKILSAFRGDAKGGLDAMTESIRNMDVTGIVEELKIVIKFMGTLLKVAGGIAKAFDIIGTGLGVAAAKFSLMQDARKGASLTGFDDFGGDEESQSPVVGPNQREAAARAQQVAVSVGGTIDVNGPPGTTAESDGPVGFNVAALGTNQ
jgi:TP901 family phage tail tape measure protein